MTVSIDDWFVLVKAKKAEEIRLEKARKAEELQQEKARRAEEKARKAEELQQEKARKAEELLQEKARKAEELQQEKARRAEERARKEADNALVSLLSSNHFIHPAFFDFAEVKKQKSCRRKNKSKQQHKNKRCFRNRWQTQ